ncbi:DUF4870 domain-containing protein [Phormidium yuhuli AB48]|uniref:DUF4870 domain-containing protein n=1 Tax=Phormidium yuhuli AB48 TaxID=2940671 RepID=A0ABY5AM03_9CYAN|nr:DUF4870 domain-containing protein [Phormidium yuhuli]USR89857.1 DUF4870 domain-containing protein [Phormidium yuhuli AB48]
MDSDQRKILSILCHASVFLSWTLLAVGIPVALFLLVDDQAVKTNAREVLNFYINLLIYGALIGVLWALVITIPVAFVLGILVGIANVVLPILAILKVASNPDQSYRYPFIIHLL